MMAKKGRGRPKKVKAQSSSPSVKIKYEVDDEELLSPRSSGRRRVKMDYKALANGSVSVSDESDEEVTEELTAVPEPQNSEKKISHINKQTPKFPVVKLKGSSNDKTDTSNNDEVIFENLSFEGSRKRSRKSNKQEKAVTKSQRPPEIFQSARPLKKSKSKHDSNYGIHPSSSSRVNIPEFTVPPKVQIVDDFKEKLISFNKKCINEDEDCVFSGVSACLSSVVIDTLDKHLLHDLIVPFGVTMETCEQSIYLIGPAEAVMEAGNRIKEQMKCKADKRNAALLNEEEDEDEKAAQSSPTGHPDMEGVSLYRGEEEEDSSHKLTSIESQNTDRKAVSSVGEMSALDTLPVPPFLPETLSESSPIAETTAKPSLVSVKGKFKRQALRDLLTDSKDKTKSKRQRHPVKNPQLNPLVKIKKKYRLRKWCLHQRNLRQLQAAGKKVVQCKECPFKGTEKCMKMHNQRRHPKVLYNCEVCGFSVGIRYDLRRHRMKHFKVDGTLTDEAREIVAERNPDMLNLNLRDLEVGFKPVKIETKQKEEDMEGESVKDRGTEDTMATAAATENVTESENQSVQMLLDEFVDLSESRSSSSRKMRSVKDMTVKCGKCSYTAEVQSVLKHQQKVHTRVEYICPVCGAAFKFARRLRNHFSNHADSDIRLDEEDRNLLASCLDCELQDKASVLRTHTLNVHPVSLTCLLCGENFASDTKFKFHFLQNHADDNIISSSLRMASNPPAARYQCQICDKVFKHHGTYILHCKSHISSNTYSCRSCSYTARKKSTVEKHFNLVHENIQNRTCHICNKVFTNPASLKIHLKTIHKEGVDHVFQCPSCPREFTGQRYLDTHIKRIHNKEKNFFCRICGKGFFTRAPMLEHERSHTADQSELKQVVCSYCGHRFKNRCVLAQHENIHTGNKPYACTQCDKRFCHASELAKHRRAHSDERPHRCQHCGKAFKFRYKLTAHMTIHTKQGRHRCNYCQKVFTANSTLQKHNCKAKRRHTDVSGQIVSDIHGTQVHVVKPEPLDVTLVHESGEALNPELLQQVAEAVKEVTMEGQTELVKPGDGDVHVMYMCGVCNTFFQSSEEVNEHMADHDGLAADVHQENVAMEIADGDAGQQDIMVKVDVSDAVEGSSDVQVAIAALAQLTQ